MGKEIYHLVFVYSDKDLIKEISEIKKRKRKFLKGSFSDREQAKKLEESENFFYRELEFDNNIWRNYSFKYIRDISYLQRVCFSRS